MLNKDKRSLILSLVLGDGCLHYIKNNGKLYGGLTIDHGLEQTDYQSWKAQLLTKLTGRDIKMRNGHRGKSIQISVCMKKFRAWRKFTYPGGLKDIGKILPFLRHPEFALAIWLMDDGYVEPSITKNVNYSASLRLFTCSETLPTQQLIISWLKTHFDVEAKIRFCNKNDTKRNYMFLKINCKDSLKIWSKIRPFVLQFKSMRYKFRHLEQIFLSRSVQPQAQEIVKT